MTPLNPEVGGTAGKGRGQIVACRASWRGVFCDGWIQPAAGRATRLESSVLAPPRHEPPYRQPFHPTPAHPTQAWAMEGAAPDGNRGPNRGRPRRYAPLPPPAAAPGPPFPQALAKRLPAPRRARPPPPTLAVSHNLPQPRRRRVIYTHWEEQNPAGVGHFPAVGLGQFPSVASNRSLRALIATLEEGRRHHPIEPSLRQLLQDLKREQLLGAVHASPP